jgi:hypothetical protein
VWSREVRANAGGIQLKSKAGLRTATAAAAALLIAVAVAGCNRGTSESPSPVSGPTSGSEAGLSAVPASATSPQLATDSVPAASAIASAPATAVAPATPDPVASELDQIQQLIEDINNSLSGSDSSQQGGE